MKDHITPIKEQLDENMMRICNEFMAKDNPSSSISPRWYNLREWDYDNKKMVIGSTQRQSLFFEIDFDGGRDRSGFWAQFKKYRTEFLETHFPNIDTETGKRKDLEEKVPEFNFISVDQHDRAILKFALENARDHFDKVSDLVACEILINRIK